MPRQHCCANPTAHSPPPQVVANMVGADRFRRHLDCSPTPRSPPASKPAGPASSPSHAASGPVDHQGDRAVAWIDNNDLLTDNQKPKLTQFRDAIQHDLRKFIEFDGIGNFRAKRQPQSHVGLWEIARNAIADQRDLPGTQAQPSHLLAWSSPVAFVDHVDHLVGPRIDDADLIADDEIAVGSVVGEERDHLSRHGEQVHRAWNSVSYVIVEVDIRHSCMFEVERTMQLLAILRAQSAPFLRNLLATLTEGFALTGSITLLRASLILRPRLCCALALRIAFLFTLPFGARLVFTLALLLSRPLPVLPTLWLCPPVWFAPLVWLRSSIGFAAMSGLFGAIAMLRLIAAR